RAAGDGAVLVGGSPQRAVGLVRASAAGRCRRGRGVPLWVAFSPSARLSTAAFAAFGWSILVIGDMVWVAAQRINPPALSARIRQRALTIMSRNRRTGSASDDVAEVLGQLAAGAVLPYREGLK